MNWNNWFDGTQVKENANGMEKKKLLGLDNNREKYWKIASELENERNKLRANLIPDNKKELQKLKDERDAQLQIKTEEVRQIKEDRKKIREEFSLKTKHIREARREQLESNPELSENKIEKSKAWDLTQKYGQEFHKYFGHLVKKYPKVPISDEVRT